MAEVEAQPFVELRGGLFVKAEILAWVLAHERDVVAGGPGVTWKIQAGRIYPEPASALSELEKAFLKAHRWQVLAILGDEAPPCA